jgi:hypothetical protein
MPDARAEAHAALERQWAPWSAAIESIPVSRTGQPGVVHAWTIHDVVNHVQCYARFQLSQARGAISGTIPDPGEWYGDRVVPQDVSRVMNLDQRNEHIRVAGLSLTWQQLLDECAWLQTETRRWIDGLAEDQVPELVGWVPYWDPAFKRDPDDEMILLVRRARDVPAVVGQVPVWQFVLPGDHLAEHLGQIRAWLAAGQAIP